MYSGRTADTDSDEMSVSIDTMPRVTTVDETVRTPRGVRAVTAGGAPSCSPGPGLFESEMYMPGQFVRKTPCTMYTVPVAVPGVNASVSESAALV